MSAQQSTARRGLRARTPSREASTRPDLRVVPEPRRRHTLAFALATVVLLGAAVFGAVTLNALAAAESVHARALERQVADGERAYATLVAEVAALEDPGRIREAALDLGLVPSSPARHLHLDRNLPADGAVVETRLPETTSDPLKPVLSAER
jgi:hypothetical protein